MKRSLAVGILGLLIVTAAPASVSLAQGKGAATAKARAGCEPGNGGLTLPPGFCASVFADNLGRARHLTVAPNGDVYVNTWSSRYTENKNAPGGYVVGLRDADHDGKAEQVERFGTVHEDGKPGGGTGIAVHRGALFVEDLGKIVRYGLAGGKLAPAGAPEVVLTGLHTDVGHIMHPFAIASDGTLFVNSGSKTNACQEQDRTLESPGIRPCPELPLHAGIWRYDSAKRNQAFSPAERFATGTRNIVALAINPADGALYATFHGRDQLGVHFPKLFTMEQNTELPAEVFARLDRGDDFGWPYCYYDGQKKMHMLAPEYGGDGKTQGECATKEKPLLTFPAHWAPNGMAFYSGTAFPAKYRGGAFIAFHGSHDRKPQQAGYVVAFVPFKAGKPAGGYDEFATGFTGKPSVTAPTEADHRAMSVAVGPDGALYIGDDVKGRVWRITYSGGV